MKSAARKLYQHLHSLRRNLARRLVTSLTQKSAQGGRRPPASYRIAFAIYQIFELILAAIQTRLSVSLAARPQWLRETHSQFLQRLVRWADGPGWSAYSVYSRNNWPSTSDLDRQRRLAKSRPLRPLISILTPVFNAQPQWLERLVQSVLAQTYDRWEFILVDDGSTRAETREALRTLEDMDERIHVDLMTENGGVSRATNRAAALAHGEFLAFIDHDDELCPEALWQVARTLERDKDCDLLYSDEELVPEDGSPPYPAFKPGFSPELLTAYNYICHLLVVRKRMFDAVGGFRSETDGAQDFDLILRIVEKTDRVAHVPRILYRWHLTASSQSRRGDVRPGELIQPQRLGNVTRSVVQGHLDRLQIPATAQLVGDWVRPRFEPTDQGKASILIPTRDNPWLLWRAIRSVESRTDYPNFEIVILDDNSQTKVGRRLLGWLNQRHRVIRIPRGGREFSFSRLVNIGAKSVDGRFVVLLNDDVRVRECNWLSALVGTLSNRRVGVAGARLSTPRGRVQHAGVILGAMGWGPWHALMEESESDPAHLAAVQFPRNVAAVTGACLAVRRELFQELGGLDESLAVSFNDVDFCLRVQRAGFRVAYVPQAHLLHKGGASRGTSVDPQEAVRFRDRWFGVRDPYWNLNLSRDSHLMEIDVRRRRRQPKKHSPRILAVGPVDRAGEPSPGLDELIDALERRGHCRIVRRQGNEPGDYAFSEDLLQGDFDVVLAHGATAAAAVEEAACRKIACIWNLPGDLLPPREADEQAMEQHVRVLRALPLAYQAVFSNASSLNKLRRGSAIPNARLLPSASLDRPHGSGSGRDASETRSRVRRALSIGDDKVVILAAAPVADGRDLELCVKAFESLCRAVRRQAFLLLVGQGNCDYRVMRRLRRRAGRLGDSCCLTIEPGSTMEYCMAADIHLCHATGDPRPASALEAMHAGLPIVGPIELAKADLVHPGVNGWVVHRHRPKPTARSLERLLLDEHLRRQMGRASQALAQTRADAAWTISQWEALIEEAAAKTRQERSRVRKFFQPEWETTARW